MHELSVAKNLVEIVCERLEEGQRASRVLVRLGVLSGVVAKALESAYSAAVVGTPLSGSVLEIETVGLVVWCPTCDAPKSLATTQRLVCPVCQTRTPRIVQGNELEIESIEVVDESATESSANRAGA